MVTPIRAGEDLPVAGPHIYPFWIEAVGVNPLAIDALIVVGPGQATGEGLPGPACIAGAVNGELAGADAEVVLAVVKRRWLPVWRVIS